MAKSQTPHTKRRKPDLKGYIMYKPIYKTFRERQNFKDRKQINGWAGAEVGRSDYQKAWGWGEAWENSRVMKLLYSLMMVANTHLYLSAKTQRTIT